MAKVPSNPTPRAEGACTDTEYVYSGGGDKYNLYGCLSQATGGAPAGQRIVSSGGVVKDGISNANLTGWWMLDGISGTQDLSGNNRNGINYGAVTSTGKYGESLGAYYFDGASSYVSIGKQPTTGNVSVSIWLNLDVTASGVAVPIDGGVGGPSYNGHGLYINNNIMYTDLRHGPPTGTGLSRSSSVDIAKGSWINYIYTINYDTNLVTLYINGKDKVNYSSVDIKDEARADVNYTIGRYWASAQSYCKGLISDVRTYNRELSPTEAEQLYNATKP